MNPELHAALLPLIRQAMSTGHATLLARQTTLTEKVNAGMSVESARADVLGSEPAQFISTRRDLVEPIAELIGSDWPKLPDNAEFVTARLAVVSYLDGDGQQKYSVHTRGDMPTSHYLGLTVYAQHRIDEQDDQ